MQYNEKVEKKTRKVIRRYDFKLRRKKKSWLNDMELNRMWREDDVISPGWESGVGGLYVREAGDVGSRAQHARSHARRFSCRMNHL